MYKYSRCNIILGFFVLLSFVTVNDYAYGEMYLWQDQNGVFNASEERPDWWPEKPSCIEWIPGRRKVADFVETSRKSLTCNLNTEKKEEKIAKTTKKKVGKQSVPEQKVIEPTDKEIRIYCTYQKGLMKFVYAQNTEKLSADYVEKKFGVPEQELYVINSKVLDYKGGNYKCVY
ncbi:MAG: hypothetical protein ACL93V_00150 [Candidatus Electrothrix sp. YB6]